MSFTDLPALNATLNAICAVFLSVGYYQIQKGNRDTHKWLMLCALGTSVFFLTSYLIYHYNAGSVPYPHHDWTRPIYFTILIPHVILSTLNIPFIITIFLRAYQGQFEQHRRLARWVWPVWMFVSITGIIVYLMLYWL